MKSYVYPELRYIQHNHAPTPDKKGYSLIGTMHSNRMIVCVNKTNGNERLKESNVTPG